MKIIDDLHRDDLYLRDGGELPKYEFYAPALRHGGITIAEEVAECASPWDDEPILRDRSVVVRGVARWRSDAVVATWALAVLATARSDDTEGVGNAA